MIPPKSEHGSAFTLIELLVVISIIAVLVGLAFPAYTSVQNSAKKTQAKNDALQISTAVNAYYTEYGKYPIPAAKVDTSQPDFTYDDGNPNTDLMKILLAKDATENP